MLTITEMWDLEDILTSLTSHSQGSHLSFHDSRLSMVPNTVYQKGKTFKSIPFRERTND